MTVGAVLIASFSSNVRKKTGTIAKRSRENDRNFTGHFHCGAIHFRHRLFRLFCVVSVRADAEDVAGAEMIEALIIGVFILLGSLFLIFLWEIWR